MAKKNIIVNVSEGRDGWTFKIDMPGKNPHTENSAIYSRADSAERGALRLLDACATITYTGDTVLVASSGKHLRAIKFTRTPYVKPGDKVRCGPKRRRGTVDKVLVKKGLVRVIHGKEEAWYYKKEVTPTLN